MWKHMVTSHPRGLKDLFLGPVFRPVNNLGRFREILNPFLGEGSPDNVPAQVFYSGLILGENTRTAEELESGMPPVGKHGDQVSGFSLCPGES
jgi:hypothetical protein